MNGTIDVRREMTAHKALRARQKRNLEWMVLKLWWSCTSAEDSKWVERYYGPELDEALDHYYKSELYQLHRWKRQSKLPIDNK